MKIKNAEVGVLRTCLANLKNKGLSGATGYKIVKLQIELDAQAEAMDKAGQAIREEFIKEGEEVKEDDPRIQEMNIKWAEVLEESTDLKYCNFLTEDELMYCTEGLSFDVIRVANKFLVSPIAETTLEAV
jgi:hypothetical protein